MSSLHSATSAFLETTKTRRSHYQLTNTSPIPDARIRELVTHAILHVPSAFNSQTTRLLVLLKAEHEKLWDVAKEVFGTLLPPEQFGRTAERMNGFRAAYGTVRRLTWEGGNDSAKSKSFVGGGRMMLNEGCFH